MKAHAETTLPTPSPPQAHDGIADIDPTQLALFRTTSWSLVRAASGSTDAATGASWEQLLSIYRAPLIRVLQARGRSQHEAAELLVELFGNLFRRGSLKLADPAKGRFRDYLRKSLIHLDLDQRRKSQRESSCEPLAEVPVESVETEERYDADCAVAFMSRALELARDKIDDPALFNALRVLIARPGAEPLAAAAARSGVEENALNQMLHRWRRKYAFWFRELVRDSMATFDITPTDAEVNAEMYYLARCASHPQPD